MNTKILILHDESHVLDLLASEMTADGYEVVAVTNAEQAVTSAAKDRPDLILMDVAMQGETGLPVYDRLRDAGFTKDIPVIFLTAASRAHVLDDDSFVPAAV